MTTQAAIGKQDRIVVFQTAEDHEGQLEPMYRWHRRAQGNNRIICQGQAHTERRDAHRAALRANPDLRRRHIVDEPNWFNREVDGAPQPATTH